MSVSTLSLEDFFCNITLDFAKDPVRAHPGSNHIFERNALIQWNNNSSTCPTCRARITADLRVKDILLSERIEKLVKSHLRRLDRALRTRDLTPTEAGLRSDLIKFERRQSETYRHIQDCDYILYVHPLLNKIIDRQLRLEQAKRRNALISGALCGATITTIGSIYSMIVYGRVPSRESLVTTFCLSTAFFAWGISSQTTFTVPESTIRYQISRNVGRYIDQSPDYRRAAIELNNLDDNEARVLLLERE